MTTTEDLPEAELVVSPGQLLRQAREGARLTQQEVAQSLHMSVYKVNAIENDDYSKLNVDTFVRGYLRSYALLVKVDPVALINAYEQHAIARGLLPAHHQASHKESGGRKAWGFVVSLIILFAVLLLISVWFFGNRIAPTGKVAPPQTLPAATVTEAPTQPSEGIQPEILTSSEADEDAALAAEDELNQPIAQQQQAVPLDVLQLEFAEECWLEVSDANGDVLATELHRPGQRVVLQGRAPFNVKLGNAPAATVTLNGEAYALTPAPGTKVFTVDIGR